ncbi:hypothetical protein QBC46DRAFT_411708 [Diplogelasinospora grovesii]|uniref:Uncharacterized protein n=1 Tax=Diplogelasinospora grovesii TaxID=303347 RepID=A0AAN6N0C0_9PEZI|nr:hypothetical protein QBC46DRAFT_411708 [Diplogelasinospora grovesii]
MTRYFALFTAGFLSIIIGLGAVIGGGLVHHESVAGSTFVGLVEDASPEPNWYGQITYWCSVPGPCHDDWEPEGADQFAASIISETITRSRSADGDPRWELRRVSHDVENGRWSFEEVYQVKDLAKMVNSPYFETGSLSHTLTWLVQYWFIFRGLSVLETHQNQCPNRRSDRIGRVDPPPKPGQPCIWKCVDGGVKAAHGMTSLPAMEPPW